MNVYHAAEGFERELSEELGSDALFTYGPLIVSRPRERAPVWAQNTWLDPREIAISSIKDAAQKLRSLGTKLWALESFTLHRRAQLIQDQLPKFKNRSFDFLSSPPPHGLGAWTLISEDKILASPQTASAFPRGAIAFNEDKSAPSRAYLKLWELFTVHGVLPKKGERCLELGASPGGWTWVLAKLGCEIIACDRSPLAPTVMAMKNVAFKKGNAFTLKPEEIGPIDWLFSDLICYPEQLEKLIETWRQSGLCRNFVCTVKFQGATDHQATQRLREIAGARMHHLAHNKHELTWWLLDQEH